MKTTKKPIKHVYFTDIFESKINKPKEEFLIIPSQIGFSDIEFRIMIKDELAYLGMTLEELSKSTYIDINRIQSLITKNGTFNANDIKEISRVLGF